MNVSIGDARGHIHISQIVDDFEEVRNFVIVRPVVDSLFGNKLLI